MFILSPQSPSSLLLNKFTTISGKTKNNMNLHNNPNNTTPYERSYSTFAETTNESPGKFCYNHSKSCDDFNTYTDDIDMISNEYPSQQLFRKEINGPKHTEKDLAEQEVLFNNCVSNMPAKLSHIKTNSYTQHNPLRINTGAAANDMTSMSMGDPAVEEQYENTRSPVGRAVVASFQPNSINHGSYAGIRTGSKSQSSEYSSRTLSSESSSPS